MSALLSRLLWWRASPPVEEAHPALTPETERRAREKDAERLRELMDMVDNELDALRPHRRATDRKWSS